jgi:outer membrane lipoprotein SlyB
MNKLILLVLSAGLVAPMQAQLFTPESLTGAALGGITGAVIGHNSGRHGGEGAAIGAGAGLLLGSLIHHDRRERGYYHVGYDYPAHGGYYYSEPHYYRRPNYALGGALLGGVAGAVIGHNSGRHGAEGAAIGAGAGLLLGGIAESQARRRERAQAAAAAVPYGPAVEVSQQTVPQAQAAPPQPAVRPVKVSAMSSANRLFGR